MEAKKRLVSHLVAVAEAELEAMTRAADAAREAATHEEARPENDKDTRSIEAAYLAGAHAERVRALEETVLALRAMNLRSFAEDDPVALSALVVLSAAGAKEIRCFLCASGGGMRAEWNGRTVQVVTPRSPLGSAVIGQRVGDVVEVSIHGAVREYEVVSLE